MGKLSDYLPPSEPMFEEETGTEAPTMELLAVTPKRQKPKIPPYIDVPVTYRGGLFWTTEQKIVREEDPEKLQKLFVDANNRLKRRIDDGDAAIYWTQFTVAAIVIILQALQSVLLPTMSATVNNSNSNTTTTNSGGVKDWPTTGAGMGMALVSLFIPILGALIVKLSQHIRDEALEVRKQSVANQALLQPFFDTMKKTHSKQEKQPDGPKEDSERIPTTGV